MAEYDAYIICTSPRSGSTLLCNLLAQTGVAGNPASYFHRPAIADWLDYFDLALPASTPEKHVLQAIVKAAIAEGSSDNGMFGLRLQRHSFDFFTQKLAVLHPGLSGDTSRIHKAFGRTAFIHLTRLDKIEQAVSYVKAEQSGLWHMASDGTELERVSPEQIPTYDAVKIRARMEEVTTCDSQWKRWFAMESITPIRITYEDLAAQPIEALHVLLDQLGRDCEASSNVEPGVAKMADRASREWVARFRAGNVHPG